MRQYELVLIVHPNASESVQKKALDLVKGMAKDLKITKEDSLGKKILSYPIKKETSGIFYVLSMEGENIPSDFERKILNSENILRHLLVRKK